MRTVEFRDGDHEVPDHVAFLLRSVETHTMTYEEAVRLSEQQLVKDHLNKAMKSLIHAHFRENR